MNTVYNQGYRNKLYYAIAGDVDHVVSRCMYLTENSIDHASTWMRLQDSLGLLDDFCLVDSHVCDPESFANYPNTAKAQPIMAEIAQANGYYGGDTNVSKTTMSVYIVNGVRIVWGIVDYGPCVVYFCYFPDIDYGIANVYRMWAHNNCFVQFRMNEVYCVQ